MLLLYLVEYSIEKKLSQTCEGRHALYSFVNFLICYKVTVIVFICFSIVGIGFGDFRYSLKLQQVTIVKTRYLNVFFCNTGL